jgi:TPR repeat protein
LVLLACGKSAPKPGATGFADQCLLAHDQVAQLAVCEPACEAGNVEACAVAGFLVNGLRYPADPTRGMAWLVRACDGGIGKACAHLAWVYKRRPDEMPQWKDVAPDPARAQELHAKAVTALTRECDAGRGSSCEYLASYHDPQWRGAITPDVERAKQLYARAAAAWKTACDGGDGSSCGSLALAYSIGRPVRDATKKRELELRGCTLGHGPSCHEAAGTLDLATPLAATEARKSVFALYRKACDLGYYMGCVSLGTLTKDDAAYERACDLHSKPGCENAGLALEDTDPAAAAERFRKCCALGSSLCCRKIEAAAPK